MLYLNMRSDQAGYLLRINEIRPTQYLHVTSMIQPLRTPHASTVGSSVSWLSPEVVVKQSTIIYTPNIISVTKRDAELGATITKGQRMKQTM